MGRSSPPTGDAGACSPIGRASLRMAALLRGAARWQLRLFLFLLLERPVRDTAGVGVPARALVRTARHVHVLARALGRLFHRRIVWRAERSRLLRVGPRLFWHL